MESNTHFLHSSIIYNGFALNRGFTMLRVTFKNIAWAFLCHLHQNKSDNIEVLNALFSIFRFPVTVYIFNKI